LTGVLLTHPMNVIIDNGHYLTFIGVSKEPSTVSLYKGLSTDVGPDIVNDYWFFNRLVVVFPTARRFGFSISTELVDESLL